LVDDDVEWSGSGSNSNYDDELGTQKLNLKRTREASSGNEPSRSSGHVQGSTPSAPASFSQITFSSKLAEIREAEPPMKKLRSDTSLFGSSTLLDANSNSLETENSPGQLLDGFPLTFAVQCLQDFAKKSPRSVPHLKFDLFQMFAKHTVFSRDDEEYMDPHVIGSYHEYQSSADDTSFANGKFIPCVVEPLRQSLLPPFDDNTVRTNLHDINFEILKEIIERAKGK
jgi:hypothetical protein